MVDRFSRLRSFGRSPTPNEDREKRRSRLSIIVRGNTPPTSKPPTSSSSTYSSPSLNLSTSAPSSKRPFSSFFENRKSYPKNEFISWDYNQQPQQPLNDPSMIPNQSEVLESLDLIDLGPVENEEGGEGKGKGKEREKEEEEEEGEGEAGEEKELRVTVVGGEQEKEDPLKSVPCVGLGGGGSGLPCCEGFLFKQGHLFRTWKKRYFCLSPEKIQYYASNNKKVLKGELEWKPKTEICFKEPCFYSHLLVWDVPSPPPPSLVAQLKKEAGLGEEEVHLFGVEVRFCDERKKDDDKRRWRRTKKEDKEVEHYTSSPSASVFPGASGGGYQSSQLLLCAPSRQQKIDWLLDLSAHQAPLPPPRSSSSSSSSSFSTMILDDDVGIGVGKGGAGIGSQLHSAKWNTRRGEAEDASLISNSTLDFRFSGFSEGGEDEEEGGKEEEEEQILLDDGFHCLEDLENMSFDSFVNQ